MKWKIHYNADVKEIVNLNIAHVNNKIGFALKNANVKAVLTWKTRTKKRLNYKNFIEI